MLFPKMSDLQLFRFIYPLLGLKIYPDSNLHLEPVKFQCNQINQKSKLIFYLKRFLTLSQLLRIIFSSICFGFFCFNSYQIIKQYLEFNTIVMLQLFPPTETDLPAITICGPFIIDDQTLQNTFEEYKSESVHIWKANKSSSIMEKKLKLWGLRDEFEEKAIKTFSAKHIFQNLSLNINDLVTECFFVPEVIRDRWSSDGSGIIDINCSEIGPIIPSIYDGRKCFTFFSQLNNTDEERKHMKMIYEKNPSISIQVSARHNVWPVGPIQSATIIVAVHQPNIIPTHLEFDYFRIYPNNFYEVRFTKKIEYLKPPPYKTNCRNYYISNVKGERSRGDCINHCIKRETFSFWECGNYYGIITPDLFSSDEHLCERKLQNHTNYINARRKCMQTCQLSCIEESLEVFAYEIEELTFGSNSNAKTDAVIEIKSFTQPNTIIYHREEVSDTEFIGTLGGHAGIWLGLSAITLFNFMVNLIPNKKTNNH